MEMTAVHAKRHWLYQAVIECQRRAKLLKSGSKAESAEVG